MNEPEKNNRLFLFSTPWNGGMMQQQAYPLVRGLALMVVLFSLLAGEMGYASSGESRPFVFKASKLTIVSADSRHFFRIEVADTPFTRARGLMERQHLDSDAGMLFDYDKPKQIHMWMKNTYIPLDMLFIDGAGKIVGISANTTPLSTAVIASPGPVLAVLELNAGTAERLGIKIGDAVEHAIFQP